MKEFLEELVKKDVHITVAGEELSVKFPKSRVDKEVLEEIRSRKQALIEYLVKLKQNATVQIPAAAAAESYPISNGQRRIWLASRFEEASLAHNIPGTLILNQDIAIESFKKAITSTIARHEILRTVFKEDGSGELRQWVLSTEALNFKIGHVDLRQENNKEEQVRSYLEKDAHTAFNLESGPLLRVVLLQLSEKEYVLYYNLHHIIGDGWSMDVLARDLFLYYEAYRNNTAPALKPLRIQYKDYSAWQQAQLESETFKTHKAYWLEKLKGELPVLDLPVARQRPQRKTYNGYALRTCLDAVTLDKLKNYSAQHGGSLFTILLAAWHVLVYRYTSQKESIAGTPVAGREHADLEDQIGFYLNTLAFRHQLDAGESFDSFHEKVKTSTQEAYAHQAYPFDQLVEELNLLRNTSRSPVFDILLDFHNTGEKSEAASLDAEAANAITFLGKQLVKYDLELHFTEVGDHIMIQVLFNEAIYETSAIESIIHNYRTLLVKLLDHPGDTLGTIDFLPDHEKQQLLNEFNATQTEYPAGQTILDLFEAQAKNNATQVALRRGARTWSYKALDETTNRLANCLLQNYGVTKNDLVGLKLDKNEWAVISMLAVLKAGAAYVPIDPEYPAARKQQIVSDSGMKLLITDTNYLFDGEELEGAVFAIDVEFKEEHYSAEKPAVQAAPGDLAYVLYTSGSTGKPKGVMIEHSSLFNYVAWAKERYSEQDAKRLDFGLFSALTFDLTVSSIYLPLVSGGTLSLFEGHTEIASVLRAYFESGITCVKITPAHIGLLENLGLTSTAVQVAVVGGDTLEKKHVDLLRRLNPAMKIYNEYGPTESTVGCIVHEILPEDKAVLIGRPIANTGIYLLNEEGHLMPKGAPGEICISGAGLARGYLNREELTNEKFITHPFVKGERLYRTGDLGRWLPDGTMEFLGRKDEQVKIRGFRIEPGEIEQALLTHSQVTAAVVLARESQDKEKALVAYMTAASPQNTGELRNYLKGILPEYMLPSYYVQLEALPLTSNGKIDRKALTAPHGLELKSGTEYVAPRSESEHALAAIWREVLRTGRIGIDDDFFVLGGDSMKAVQITVAWNKTGKKITVIHVYDHPTIRKLAEFIAAAPVSTPTRHTSHASVPDHVYQSIPVAVEDVYPISGMQGVMIDEYEKDTSAQGIYHSVTRWRFFDPHFSVEALKQTVLALQSKNHSLRTNFFSSGNEIYQATRKTEHSTLLVEDLSAMDEATQNEHIAACMAQDIKNKFRLNHWDEFLIRFKVFVLSHDTFEFMMSFHHAIIDGWGDTVFQNELMEYYMNYRDAKPVRKEPLPNSFKEHVLLCAETSASTKAKEYWKNELRYWKLFRKEKLSKEEAFATRILVMDRGVVKGLRELAKRKGVTPKSLFLTNYITVLGKQFNTAHVSVGVVFNGRTAELTDPLNTMGLFWNILPVYFESMDQVGYETVQTKLNRGEEFSRFSAAWIKSHLGEEPNFACFNYVHFHNSKNWEKEERTPAASPDPQSGKPGLPYLLDFGGFEKYHYPLNINVGVDPHDPDTVSIRVEYNRAVIPDGELDVLLKEYLLLLSNETLHT